MEELRKRLEESIILLSRLEERTSNLAEDVKKLNQTVDGEASKFVSKEEFLPIQRTIYAIFGMVGTIIAAVIGQLLLKGLHL